MPKEQKDWNGILKQSLSNIYKESENYRKSLRSSKFLQWVDKTITAERFGDVAFANVGICFASLLAFCVMKGDVPDGITYGVSGGMEFLGQAITATFFFKNSEADKHYFRDQENLDVQNTRRYGDDWKEKMDYWQNPLTKFIGKKLADAYYKKLVRRAEHLIKKAVKDGAELSNLSELKGGDAAAVWGDILRLGDPKFLDYLIKNGLDVNQTFKDSKFNNPMELAISCGKQDLINCLIRNGAAQEFSI